jgi:hypothetical protein
MKPFCTLVKVKGKVFPFYAMKVRRYEDEWSTSLPSCFAAEKYQWYQLNLRYCEPHSRSERFREEKNIFSLSGFEHRTIQSLVVCK